MTATTRALLLATVFALPARAQSTPQETDANAATAAQAGSTAASDGPADGLEDIVVTATKRAENLQAVPLSIQAIGTERLEQLQVTDLNDYVQFLPQVSITSAGPGFSQVFFRGIASGEGTNHSASLPTVATYLDEQPITTIQGALDIHVYDIARVEAIAGPQSTLYGASAEAGVLRIITNKPEFGRFYGGADAEGNVQSEGDPGATFEGFANIPVAENVAVRLVGWYEYKGGYIDNVEVDRFFPTSNITTNNAEFVKDDFNDVETFGGRVALRWEPVDGLIITPTIMGQKQHSAGVFGYQKSIGRLETGLRRDQGAKDRWLQAALTVEGRIGSVDVVYNGSYLDRHVSTVTDYADYSFFYDVLAGYTLQNDAGENIDPSQYVLGRDHFTTNSHELRFATDKDARFSALGGVFYQRRTDGINQNYVVDNLADELAVFPERPDNIWLTRQKRVDRDYAVFAEGTIQIIPDRLKISGGGRYYWYDNSLKGFFGFGIGYSGGTGVGRCVNRLQNRYGQPFPEPVIQNSPCTSLLDEEEYAETGRVRPARAEGDDFLPRANITWTPTDDILAYFTYSQGYRPGGINRRGGPYQVDTLDNFEIGFKTSWLDRRLRVNGALYYLKWQDVQFSFLGANGLTEIQNAGDAEVKGFEFEIQAAPITGLTLSLGGSYNDAELVENFCANDIENDPDCVATAPDGTPINAVLAPDGQRLPFTARFKGSAIARYDWGLTADLDAHVQGSVTGQTNSNNALRTGDLGVLGTRKGYELVDMNAGVGTDRWSAEIYVKNLFDARPDLLRSTQCATAVCTEVYTVTARPRLVGVRVGRKF